MEQMLIKLCSTQSGAEAFVSALYRARTIIAVVGALGLLATPANLFIIGACLWALGLWASPMLVELLAGTLAERWKSMATEQSVEKLNRAPLKEKKWGREAADERYGKKRYSV